MNTGWRFLQNYFDWEGFINESFRTVCEPVWQINWKELTQKSNLLTNGTLLHHCEASFILNKSNRLSGRYICIFKKYFYSRVWKIGKLIIHSIKFSTMIKDFFQNTFPWYFLGDSGKTGLVIIRVLKGVLSWRIKFSHIFREVNWVHVLQLSELPPKKEPIY